MPRKPENLTGKQYGALTVLGSFRYKETKDGKKRIQWLCSCNPLLGGCGIVKWIYRDSLLNARTKNKSCGICIPGSHGMSETPEYRTWINMHQRCYNPKNSSFPNYGGRGIEVDEVWHDFKQFFKDMGKRPSDQHSLDKVNNYANYGPGNCVWATATDQNLNRRSN